MERNVISMVVNEEIIKKESDRLKPTLRSPHKWEKHTTSCKIAGR